MKQVSRPIVMLAAALLAGGIPLASTSTAFAGCDVKSTTQASAADVASRAESQDPKDGQVASRAESQDMKDGQVASRAESQDMKVQAASADSCQ